MATRNNPQDTQDLENARLQTGAIDEQATSLTNVLSLKMQANKAAKEELDLRSKIAKLGQEEARRAIEYKETTLNIKEIEKDLQNAKESGNRRAVSTLKAELAAEQRKQAEQRKTAGGSLMAMTLEARNRKIALQAERQLIKDINKERGIGGKIMDFFRTKEAKQRSIDIARAKVGGGINTGPGVASSKGLIDSFKESKLGQGLSGAMGGLVVGIKAAMGPLKELGNQVKAGLTSSLAGAANLLTGEDYGMGGGKANASGATSILGGLSSILKTIPLVGGILGGVVDMFKAMLDAVLGVEQANFRVGRALNISAGAADNMRKQFDGIAAASDNIVVNSTRMLQSQVEISKQLGTNKQLSADILVNDVKLRDILGLEAESRQKIAESSIVTGRNATKLTQGIIGTVGAFNKLVGTSFKFNDIVGEASKMSGVMGLTFAKYPEKLTKAILSVKTLGFDLKQLDSTAESFLDFEGSISKEMEAQVLTGKDMNLTAAREAALNNDNAKLASEITKNVGDANTYLKMNRIQQEAIAQSVGMSRDSLADVLKKQEMYSKLGATDVATFNKKIELLEKQGKTQEQISAMIGKDAYNTYTQVSTAEKLSEVMERIKKTFVDFLRNSGLFEFITDPVKINNFIKGMADKLASTINMIGEIIAMMLDGVGSLPFTDKEKWSGMAAQVRSGAGGLAGSIRSSTDSLGGTPAGSISGNVEKGTKQENTYSAKSSADNARGDRPIQNNVYVTVDETAIAKASTKYSFLIPGQTKD
jgi:ElaB/YqjD/DUF883 family membrane-anchored ribosome-binding protein